MKQFATRLCVSLALLIALLVTGECIAYVVYRYNIQQADKYEYRSYVLWRVSHSRRRYISLDENGLRRTLYSHCDAGAYTIWMFGGSGLWGNYIRDGETIPSWLAKHYEDSGRPVCVRNYGQRGWGNTQEVIQLMLELKRTQEKPDVVIFYDGSIDSILPAESGPVDVHLGFPQWKEKFQRWRAGNQAGFEYLRNTNTYLFLGWLTNRFHLRDPGRPSSMSAQRAALLASFTFDNYSKNMKILDALAAGYGFHYVCFWEPWLLSGEKPLSSAEELIQDGSSKTNPGPTEMRRITYALFRAANQPRLVYLADLFTGHPETLFVDQGHLGAEGNRLVAQRIYEVLQHLGP